MNGNARWMLLNGVVIWMPNCWYDDDKCMMMLGVFLWSLWCFTNAQAMECLVTKIIPTTIPSVTILTYVLEILGQIYKYSFSCTRYIQMYTISFNLQIKAHPACPWVMQEMLEFFPQMKSIALKLLRLWLLIHTGILMITTTMANDNPNDNQTGSYI